MLTLHVTNGDVAAGALARSGLPGDIVSWRDVLHDGPVPPDDDLAAFHRTRANFLAARGAGPAEGIVTDFAERDARLADAGVGDEVVLWFEPDLYDQLQLVQVLARLGRLPDEARPRITIAPADCFLGPMAPDRFPPLFAARRPVDADDLTIGVSAWRAFTAATPDALTALTGRLAGVVHGRSYLADDTVRLPHLAAALRRQLEEYPDVAAGLSRTMRQICEALDAAGALTPQRLFAANQATESWMWLGDTNFTAMLDELMRGATPVIARATGSRVHLTDFGRALLRGDADLVRANGLDRWIGGVHCTVSRHWRWDTGAHRLVPGEG